MLTTTGSGESVLLVSWTSADAVVAVNAVFELLAGVGSVLLLAAVAVFEICVVTLEFTLTTIVKVAVPPVGTDEFEKTTSPVLPAVSKSVRDQPAVPVVAETSVVPVGTVSVTVAFVVSLGPLFMKLMV